jgi:hypothetical protein
MYSVFTSKKFPPLEYRRANSDTHRCMRDRSVQLEYDHLPEQFIEEDMLSPFFILVEISEYLIAL